MTEEPGNYSRSSSYGGDDNGGGGPRRWRIRLCHEKTKKRSILHSSPNSPSSLGNALSSPQLSTRSQEPLFRKGSLAPWSNHPPLENIGMKRHYSELSSARESSNPSQVTLLAVPRPRGSNPIPSEGGSRSGPPTVDRSLKKIREENDDSYEEILKLTPPENEDNGPDPDGNDFIIRLNEDERG